jgi:hypothetical protein
MVPIDLYLKTTDARGCVTFTDHRVWDANRFMAARGRDADADHAKALQDDPKLPRLAKAEQLTEAQFKARK